MLENPQLSTQLRGKRSAKVAPIPGETRVWQYIALTKRIYLIDSPGHVQDPNEDQTDKVLKGVVRPEKVPDPDQYVQPILDRAGQKGIENVYGIS